MRIIPKTNINFIRWRWHALALSLLILGAGVATIVARGGLPLGIDFSGGTIVVVRFDRALGNDDVLTSLRAVQGETTVQRYGPADGNEWLIRLPQMEGEEEGTNLEAGARAINAALEASDLGPFEPLSTDIVGPVIGRELQRKGIYATLTALLGIMIYVALRFRFTFAVGAIVAALHDILITIVFLVWFGYDLSLNIIAAILTITGYSVNDTIVVFDRVRENLRSQRRDKLEDVVNKSVNDTLARTIITSGTTLLAMLSLFLFGGEVLQGFAFTMLVGVVAGTYSTVFIASAIAIMLSGRKSGGTGRAMAPAAGAAPADGTAPVRPRRGRRAGR
ncbi:MAG TPA: protein translocase subunit SecF [Vicinamibacterales bacterium]|nr:protein translocase subunit SecF [Vicinamibacterales bacterium]